MGLVGLRWRVARHYKVGWEAVYFDIERRATATQREWT